MLSLSPTWLYNESHDNIKMQKIYKIIKLKLHSRQQTAKKADY